MKIILAVIFATISSVAAFSQEPARNVLHGTVEQENAISGGKVAPQVKVFLTYAGKTKSGWYCWFQASKPYSQFYCGPSYQPTGWIQVGAAIGLETGKKPLKGAMFVWTGKGKFSNLLVLEKGSAALWYRNQASFKASKSLTVSIASQRYQGAGPRVDIVIPKTNFSVGGEYLSTRTAKFGFKYSF